MLQITEATDATEDTDKRRRLWLVMWTMFDGRGCRWTVLSDHATF